MGIAGRGSGRGGWGFGWGLGRSNSRGLRGDADAAAPGRPRSVLCSARVSRPCRLGDRRSPIPAAVWAQGRGDLRSSPQRVSARRPGRPGRQPAGRFGLPSIVTRGVGVEELCRSPSAEGAAGRPARTRRNGWVGSGACHGGQALADPGPRAAGCPHNRHDPTIRAGIQISRDHGSRFGLWQAGRQMGAGRMPALDVDGAFTRNEPQSHPAYNS
jgi:hypothetical protein